MAAVKNPKFGNRGGLEATDFDQVIPIKNAGWGNRQLFSMRGGWIRNLGVAVVKRGIWNRAIGVTETKHALVVYAHSQVSNGPHTGWPAGGFVLDEEAAEQLAAMLLGGLHALREASK